MENIIFTSEPIVALIITILTVVLIVLGRKLEMPQIPVVVVIYSLAFLMYHTINFNNTKLNDLTNFYFSMAFDLVILFLGFITYLWIDNIVAKNKNLKSYGDPLSWFWDRL